jgi:exosortase A
VRTGAAATAWRPALLSLGIGLLALLALFRAEALAAVKVWNESTAFGHCYLVLPIAVCLAWERRGALVGLAPRPLHWLALLALPTCCVWFVADRLGLMEGRQFAVLAMVWLLAFTVLGWRVGWALAVPLAYLVFLVPFGAFLVPLLQDVTARFIDVGLTLLDIPHVVTDTLIEISEGSFRVAAACAGLRFLIAAIAFGALYACVIYRSAARRLTFIAVCVVVPVLANGIRALGIVILGHIRGSAEAGAVDHVVYGWLFFSIVIVLLLLLGLPFRQDGQASVTPVRPKAVIVPTGPSAAVAALLLAVLAAAGPAAAAWLDRRGQAQSAELSGEADRSAAAMVTPAGCVAASLPEGAPPGLRRFDCGGVLLEARIRLFGPWAGLAALAARREATQWGSEEDAETAWLETPGARWQLVHTRDPDRSAAAALWLDGMPAPTGLELRQRLALGDNGNLTLVTISAATASPAALTAMADLARVQSVPKHP